MLRIFYCRKSGQLVNKTSGTTKTSVIRPPKKSTAVTGALFYFCPEIGLTSQAGNLLRNFYCRKSDESTAESCTSLLFLDSARFFFSFLFLFFFYKILNLTLDSTKAKERSPKSPPTYVNASTICNKDSPFNRRFESRKRKVLRSLRCLWVGQAGTIFVCEGATCSTRSVVNFFLLF